MKTVTVHIPRYKITQHGHIIKTGVINRHIRIRVKKSRVSIENEIKTLDQ